MEVIHLGAVAEHFAESERQGGLIHITKQATEEPCVIFRLGIRKGLRDQVPEGSGRRQEGTGQKRLQLK
jgi:hypothetical protein